MHGDESHLPRRRSSRIPFGIIAPPLQAVIIVVIAIGMSVIWWLPLRFIGLSLEKQDMLDQLNPLARYFIDHPWHIQLLMLPAILAGASVFFVKRGRLVLVGIAWCLELIPMAALVYVFISFLAPLYTYQEL